MGMITQMLDNFAAFILTHGRPDHVVTYKTLRRQGYTGPIYIIIDNEDKTAPKYREAFGDQVIVFDKKAVAETFDEADNFDDRRAIVYARNACFYIAEELGVEYFIQLDDDYTEFKYRINHRLEHPQDHFTFKNGFDKVVGAMLSYYKSTTFRSIAFAQGGDFFAGGNAFGKKPKRKCMNSFICSTNRRFNFVGRINEDVNTYTWFQSQGNTFLTIPFIQLDQLSTQSNSGGMTDIYLDQGTYIKSFYTVIFQPSSVKIGLMGRTNRRLHHVVNWDNTVPMILREKHKKAKTPVTN